MAATAPLYNEAAAPVPVLDERQAAAITAALPPAPPPPPAFLEGRRRELNALMADVRSVVTAEIWPDLAG